jgi:hypothetical protein
MADLVEGSAAVISNLGKLAGSSECNVSCGGTIPEVKNVDLVYKKRNGDWSSKPLQLPADLADEKLREFLDACPTAGDGEAVTEGTNLKLDPKCFQASFEIANTFVPNYISKIMSLGSPVRAELCMLSVYSTGGHFKSHVDTPRSKDMFGSLVVCLPSEFTGGAFVTRHQGHEVTFDWSASATTHWAAFFSDVEHEVLPVTSGHQITLTYKLYHLSGKTMPNVSGIGLNPGSLDVTVYPLYHKLLAVLQNPQFMRGGGTLGFCCQHKYSDPSTDLEAFSPFIEGGDAIILRIAKALKLPISLKPLLCNQLKRPVSNLGDKDRNNYFLSRFIPHQELENKDDIDEGRFVKKALDDLVKIKDITWIQPPTIFTPLLSFIKDKGETPLPIYISVLTGRFSMPIFGPVVYYQSATLLIEVPKSTSRRGSPQCDDGLPAAKRV